MRPWQNALAIVAAFLVAGSLLPIGELRIACAFGAGGIVLLLLVFRLRSHKVVVQKKRSGNVYGQVAQIRAARNERLQRKGGRR
jgi:hypothetical protein